MAFGRTLVSDNDGNYKGPLMLTLKKGYVLQLFKVLALFICLRMMETNFSRLVQISSSTERKQQ